jgi:hypothetical protein
MRQLRDEFLETGGSLRLEVVSFVRVPFIVALNFIDDCECERIRTEADITQASDEYDLRIWNGWELPVSPTWRANRMISCPDLSPSKIFSGREKVIVRAVLIAQLTTVFLAFGLRLKTGNAI